jgi:LmbE family N-acetylglucosaminyl deacetylase
MTRRQLLQTVSGAAAAASLGRGQTASQSYKGRTMVVVTAHADDFTIFAGGTLAKMIKEGYTAHLIRVTNDEKDSQDLSLGETVARNERELRKAADVIGIQEIFSLNFRNDEMDPVPETEVRQKLILLFRKLKPWTLVTFDPSAKYEENPDHKKTARAAEDAAWTSAGHLYEPEQAVVGLGKWAVLDRYYWARSLDPQDVNKVVDISSTIDQKIRAVQQHKTMMDHTAHQLKEKLAEANLRLPLLDTVDEPAVDKMVDIHLREWASALGAQHGLKYAEVFHYIPIEAEGGYVMTNAVPIR